MSIKFEARNVKKGGEKSEFNDVLMDWIFTQGGGKLNLLFMQAKKNHKILLNIIAV